MNQNAKNNNISITIIDILKEKKEKYKETIEEINKLKIQISLYRQIWTTFINQKMSIEWKTNGGMSPHLTKISPYLVNN
jgi:hypothetical protein